MLPLLPLGHGAGLRTVHYQEIEAGLAGRARAAASLANIQWFEVISENFMEPGGNPRRMLRRVREHFPVVLHGVSLSIGSTDPLNRSYLDRLAALAREVEPALISDHLCWSSLRGHYAHDLLPLPFTEEALGHVAGRIRQVQDRLGRRILIENVSSYVTFRNSPLAEWEFLGELCERTDCGLLLDVNNVFVSAHNHGFDARKFVAGVPVGRVQQIHLAGHSRNGALLLDTHDHAVRPEVWALYRQAIALHGAVPTLIEWDDRIPSLRRLGAEVARARAEAGAALREAA